MQSVNARTPVSCSSTPTSVTIILDLSVQEVDATRMHPCDVVAEPEKRVAQQPILPLQPSCVKNVCKDGLRLAISSEAFHRKQTHRHT